MTALRRTGASVLLIAGGVGSTPILAMVETFDIGDGRPSLIYRARTPADVIFRHETLEWLAVIPAGERCGGAEVRSLFPGGLQQLPATTRVRLGPEPVGHVRWCSSTAGRSDLPGGIPQGRCTGGKDRETTECSATALISNPSDHVEDRPGTPRCAGLVLGTRIGMYVLHLFKDRFPLYYPTCGRKSTKDRVSRNQP